MRGRVRERHGEEEEERWERLCLLKVAIKRAMGTQFELLPAGFASFSLHPFTVSHALGCVLSPLPSPRTPLSVLPSHSF